MRLRIDFSLKRDLLIEKNRCRGTCFQKRKKSILRMRNGMTARNTLLMGIVGIPMLICYFATRIQDGDWIKQGIPGDCM